MDYSQLRSMLEPLVTGLKDAATHTTLPALCEELGLPALLRTLMAPSANA